jgi:hypothetical protein
MTLLPHLKKPVQSVTAEAFERHYSILEIAKMWSLSNAPSDACSTENKAL